MHLNHPETNSAPWSVEKLSSTKPILSAIKFRTTGLGVTVGSTRTVEARRGKHWNKQREPKSLRTGHSRFSMEFAT